MPFLTSKGVSILRSGAPLLNLPDLTINRENNLLILGPSGSGKTTLLSVLAGLLKPNTGRVSFEQQDIYALSPRARDKLRGRDIGFIFQNLHLIPSLTLEQNIVLASDIATQSTDMNRLEQLLLNLNLIDKRKRKPSALSQGEQQRVAIARAVINHPKVILADEPTSALDDANADTVMTLLIQQAKQTGASLIIATHDNRITRHFKHILTLDNLYTEAV